MRTKSASRTEKSQKRPASGRASGKVAPGGGGVTETLQRKADASARTSYLADLQQQADRAMLGPATPAPWNIATTDAPVQRVFVEKSKLNTPFVLGNSKAGDFGGAQASLFYTAKGYPHIHATEALIMSSGRGKKKKAVYAISDIHYSDGSNTFWWEDNGSGTFSPKTESAVPSTDQKNLAEDFVSGWGTIT